MYISKIKIHNFKCYRKFELDLDKGVNVIVGDNEVGKSTILEAVNLAISGYLHGKSIRNNLSQYIFNLEVVQEYINSINNKKFIMPPEISIEVYFEEGISKILNGDDNTDNNNDAIGFVFQIKFNDEFKAEYETLIKESEVKSIPIEYYEIKWTSFARENISTRSIPFNCLLVDSSEFKYQNGQDLYLSKILKNSLSKSEIVGITQAHRKMKESFAEDNSIKKINNRLISQSKLLNGRDLKVNVDLGSNNSWENSLITELDDIPFNNMGKGLQCIIKTDIALASQMNEDSQMILLEEPENHLSHVNLNRLVKHISNEYNEKQILITTHSSFVANKLGLDKIIMLKNNKYVRFRDLKNETYDFFKKIAGYDTLRLILSKKTILCEGDSDELIIQKAYMQLNDGRLPIEDGIEVISVGVSFLRFLEIAELIDAKVVVVTDNDGNLEALNKKYKTYIGNAFPNIKICYSKIIEDGPLNQDERFNYNTLEPELYRANGLDKINEVLNKESKNEDEALKHMHSNKTQTALSFFDYEKSFDIPLYICEAIEWLTN